MSSKRGNLAPSLSYFCGIVRDTVLEDPYTEQLCGQPNLETVNTYAC